MARSRSMHMSRSRPLSMIGAGSALIAMTPTPGAVFEDQDAASGLPEGHTDGYPALAGSSEFTVFPKGLPVSGFRQPTSGLVM